MSELLWGIGILLAFVVVGFIAGWQVYRALARRGYVDPDA